MILFFYIMHTRIILRENYVSFKENVLIYFLYPLPNENLINTSRNNNR